MLARKKRKITVGPPFKPVALPAKEFQTSHFVNHYWLKRGALFAQGRTYSDRPRPALLFSRCVACGF
jgi:hypothetical protein